MDSRIPGVILRPLGWHGDARGRLCELFRSDELPDGFEPAMGYISYTLPGVARGPHEHERQTDCFVFLDGDYELFLWENRGGNPLVDEVHSVGADAPTVAIVPPGVVHAYRNFGPSAAYVLNFPDALYAGEGRAEPVDEIRHEDEPDSRFQLP